LKRIVVGMSGSTGAIYGIRLLEVLREIPEVESHLVISKPAKQTIVLETDYTVEQVECLAHTVYRYHDIAAAISSGSFKTHGMVVIPCAMKTLSGIAHSYSDNLLVRAADVTLKERRPLVVVPRETPLNRTHLVSLLALHDAGAVVLPASPAFYTGPTDLQQLVDFLAGRVLDALGVGHTLYRRWTGELGAARSPEA
jgi:4-hydroxy-3-polyprenylbenzoate decarboxylase